MRTKTSLSGALRTSATCAPERNGTPTLWRLAERRRGGLKNEKRQCSRSHKASKAIIAHRGQMSGYSSECATQKWTPTRFISKTALIRAYVYARQGALLWGSLAS